jgi:hypothetical protein
VEAKDPKACGEKRLPADMTAEKCAAARLQGEQGVVTVCDAALNVRRGDIRFHQVNTIASPQTPSPWGIMTDSNDPLTGETIAASINVWSHVTDLWSQGIVDTSRYIKGELSTSEITEGTYVRDWAAAAEAASTNGSLPKLTQNQYSELVANFANTNVEALKNGKAMLEANPALKSKLRAMDKQLQNVRADLFAPSTNRPVYETRKRRAWGSATEAALTTKMMQSYAGGLGKLGSQAALEAASPLRGAHPMFERDLHARKELALAEQGTCIMGEAQAPFAIVDLAKQLESKFGAFDKNASKKDQLVRAEKMRRYLADRAHYAVISHEMGHSVGLRHNFVSSSDAWNYRPQYWQLRTDNGVNKIPCGTTPSPDGSCVGPRYFDAVNGNEKSNLLSMWMNSSTMDYAGEGTQDLLGLGSYDFAAARMFYGDVASVLADPAFKVGSPRSLGPLEKLDNFGGILGFKFTIADSSAVERTATKDIHYSQLNAEYDLIKDCKEVDPGLFKPASWDEGRYGKWSPLLDGLIVQVGGKYTRCRQQPIDFVNWGWLRSATSEEVGFTRAASSVDVFGRVRFPYGFATDRWADLGNLSVYRHDNGADPYELFDFLITQQEVNHIFDNYRRNRQTFSVRSASQRTLNRYNTKIRDGAKGLGLMVNVYRDFAVELGYDFQTFWPLVTQLNFADNAMTSGIAFDHFVRQMARPEIGPHYLSPASIENAAPTLRSATDVISNNPGATVLNVPNGATGYFGNVSPGGRPLENALSENQGEYDSEFTVNAGSYYDKAFTAMLMTESEDNFISDSRRDFLDARYRSVSMADLYPDGYRRWLANNLTGDVMLKGMRVAANTTGQPLVTSDKYPSSGFGYTSWWKPTPDTCFAQADSLQCAPVPANTLPLDPQVGWEQQKFLIAWTLMYLPENQQQTWLNQLGIWEVGSDTDPKFGNRIEFHSPTGKVYVAKTFGKETLFGKSVQKGVSARVLEWANELLFASYETDAGPDADGDSKPDWYLVKLTGGQPRVKYDPAVKSVNELGQVVTGRPGCDSTTNAQCTCTSNRACLELERYLEVPFFMRQAMRDYGLADPTMKGIY